MGRKLRRRLDRLIRDQGVGFLVSNCVALTRKSLHTLQRKDRGSRAGTAAGLGPHARVMNRGGPEVACWPAGTGLLGVQQDERFAGVSRRQGVGTTCRQGIQRAGKMPLLWERQLRARATSVNLCGHKPAGWLGLPQRHTRAWVQLVVTDRG